MVAHKMGGEDYQYLVDDDAVQTAAAGVHGGDVECDRLVNEHFAFGIGGRCFRWIDGGAPFALSMIADGLWTDGDAQFGHWAGGDAQFAQSTMYHLDLEQMTYVGVDISHPATDGVECLGGDDHVSDALHLDHVDQC